MTDVLRRSSIRLSSMASGHKHLKLLIDDFSNVKKHSEQFYEAQILLIKRLSKWSLDEKNEELSNICKYFEELSLLWTGIQKEFSSKIKEVKCQFSCILEEENDVDQLRKKVYNLEKKEEELNKVLSKPNGTIDRKKEAKVQLAQTRENISRSSVELKEKMSQVKISKEKRTRDGLKQYGESFIHLSKKCQIIFQCFYKAAVHLPDITNPLSSDTRDHNLELIRVSVSKAKSKIEEYNLLPFPTFDNNVSGVGLEYYDSPPPYSATAPQSPPIGFHRYDQVASDFGHLSMNSTLPSSSPIGRYQNVPSTSCDQGAVGGQ